MTSSSTFRTLVTHYLLEHNGIRLRMGMGGAYIGVEADSEKLDKFHFALHHAFDRGIRYFDTSAQYGGSEFRFGRFLSEIKRDQVFVATKSPIPMALTAEEAGIFVRQAVYNSIDRLNVNHIDLYQIHDVLHLDQVMPDGGALDSLLRLQKSGVIRYIGLACRYHDLLKTAVDDGRFDTILTYADYTPSNQTAESLISHADDQGIGVINGSPLGFGLYTGKDPRKNDSLSGEFRQQAASAGRVYDLATKYGVSITSVAMQLPLRTEGISITLTGAVSPEELDATLEASSAKIPEALWEELKGI